MIDWLSEQARIDRFTHRAISRFSREHPTEQPAAFMYDSEPRYGYVFISIDTLEHNIHAAQHLEQFAVGQRRKMLTRPTAWQYAKHQINTPVLQTVSTGSGDFAFVEYAELKCPSWPRLLRHPDYPKPSGADDYLEGNVRLLFLRAIDRIIEHNLLDKWRLASPFILGYAFHDEGENILRILNWPQAGNAQVPPNPSSQRTRCARR